MADWIWGYPLEGGETVPAAAAGVRSHWAYKVSADGTRRIEPHRSDIQGVMGDGRPSVVRRSRLQRKSLATYHPTTTRL